MISRIEGKLQSLFEIQSASSMEMQQRQVNHSASVHNQSKSTEASRENNNNSNREPEKSFTVGLGPHGGADAQALFKAIAQPLER